MLRSKSLFFRANLLSANANPLWSGLLLAVLATTLFSLATPLSRHAILLGMNPTTMLLGRMWISTLLIAAVVGIGRGVDLRVSRQGLWVLLIVGISSSINILTYYWALTRLESSMAIMLFAVNPIAVLGLLALRGERLLPLHFWRLGLALLGVYLLIGPAGTIDPIGIFLVFLSVIGFAVQMALAQWYLRPYPATAVTYYIALISTVGVTVWWALSGADLYVPGLQGWIMMIVLAVVSTFLARLCFYAAIQRVGSGQMSLLMSLETMLSVTWSMLFLGEVLLLWQWLGAGFILVSALLAAKERPQSQT
ncbi:MAG: DMT family transporter [Caldilineaceae bacterium]|nr:DMT family transporter [Caldilineaceae bacterium]